MPTCSGKPRTRTTLQRDELELLKAELELKVDLLTEHAKLTRELQLKVPMPLHLFTKATASSQSPRHALEGTLEARGGEVTPVVAPAAGAREAERSEPKATLLPPQPSRLP